MKNFVQDGKIVTVTAAANTVAGAPVLQGGTLFGVCVADAAINTPMELAIEGVFTLPADNNLVITTGDRVFWVPASSWVDKTAAGQVCVGIAVTDKLQAGTTVNVKLGANTPSGT